MSAAKECLITTGNILQLNELKLKVGLTPKEELKETLKIVLDQNNKGDGVSTANSLTSENVDRKELKITIKVFISTTKAEVLRDALDKALDILQTDSIESLILAFDKSETLEDELTGLQSLWTVIEEYVSSAKLMSVGVSDVDTDLFIKLFNWSKVKPNIIQINLDACCVVPPALQEFSKDNDIMLLTHNDPCQILPKETVTELYGTNARLDWVVRYQVHLKCRGVLSSKGYLVQIKK